MHVISWFPGLVSFRLWRCQNSGPHSLVAKTLKMPWNPGGADGSTRNWHMLRLERKVELQDTCGLPGAVVVLFRPVARSATPGIKIHFLHHRSPNPLSWRRPASLHVKSKNHNVRVCLNIFLGDFGALSSQNAAFQQGFGNCFEKSSSHPPSHIFNLFRRRFGQKVWTCRVVKLWPLPSHKIQHVAWSSLFAIS